MPLSLERLREGLQGAPVGVIARLADVDRSTVRRVRDGLTDPSVFIFNKLEAALAALRRERVKAA